MVTETIPRTSLSLDLEDEKGPGSVKLCVQQPRGRSWLWVGSPVFVYDDKDKVSTDMSLMRYMHV